MARSCALVAAAKCGCASAPHRPGRRRAKRSNWRCAARGVHVLPRSTALSKAGALHLHQLVDQHVAGGADVALEAQAAAQQEGLAVGAAVGELREVQVDALDVVQARPRWRADRRRWRSCSTFGLAVVDVVLGGDAVLQRASFMRASSTLKRAPLAAALKGSMPTRRKRVDEGLAALRAAVAVGVEHGLDHVRHFGRRERGADHLAGLRARRSARSRRSRPA